MISHCLLAWTQEEQSLSCFWMISFCCCPYICIVVLFIPLLVISYSNVCRNVNSLLCFFVCAQYIWLVVFRNYSYKVSFFFSLLFWLKPFLWSYFYFSAENSCKLNCSFTIRFSVPHKIKVIISSKCHLIAIIFICLG